VTDDQLEIFLLVCMWLGAYRVFCVVMAILSAGRFPP